MTPAALQEHPDNTVTEATAPADSMPAAPTIEPKLAQLLEFTQKNQSGRE